MKTFAEFQEETKILFGKPKSHSEKVTKKLNKFSATFDLNKSPKFGLKILGQEIPPKNIEVKRSLTPSTAIDRALEKFKKSKKTVDEQAIVNSVGGGQIAGTVEAGDDPPVGKRRKKGEPTIIARGCMPGARGRFKGGVQLLANLKKNKYT